MFCGSYKAALAWAGWVIWRLRGHHLQKVKNSAAAPAVASKEPGHHLTQLLVADAAQNADSDKGTHSLFVYKASAKASAPACPL